MTDVFSKQPWRKLHETMRKLNWVTLYVAIFWSALKQTSFFTTSSFWNSRGESLRKVAGHRLLQMLQIANLGSCFPIWHTPDQSGQWALAVMKQFWSSAFMSLLQKSYSWTETIILTKTKVVKTHASEAKPAGQWLNHPDWSDCRHGEGEREGGTLRCFRKIGGSSKAVPPGAKERGEQLDREPDDLINSTSYLNFEWVCNRLHADLNKRVRLG